MPSGKNAKLDEADTHHGDTESQRKAFDELIVGNHSGRVKTII